MNIQVLGCSAVELPNANLPSFLVDGKLLLDAGTIGTVLDEKDQWKIRHVLITHSHVDHIKDLPFLADNISVSNKKHHVNVISIPGITGSLKDHLFNDILWPDFTRIPTPDNPIIKFKSIYPGKVYVIGGYQITAFEVKHTVLAERLHALIIEVSLPNRFTNRALATGHLTPGLLASEIRKMNYVPDVIHITHCKPRYKLSIESELRKFAIGNIRILTDGEQIVI